MCTFLVKIGKKGPHSCVCLPGGFREIPSPGALTLGFGLKKGRRDNERETLERDKRLVFFSLDHCGTFFF